MALASEEFQFGGMPVHVARVVVDGAGRTKNHILTATVEKILKASTFKDMIKCSHEAKIRMEKLGLFKSINITVDSSKGENLTRPSYDVIFDVKEPRRVTGAINTLVGTNDAGMMFGATMPNTTGRGEIFKLQYTHGMRQQQSINTSFSRPLMANPDIRLSFNGGQQHGELPWSAYRQTDRLLTSDLSFPSLLGVHTFKWEYVWRDLRALPTAPFTVREDAGHTLKSSIIHKVSRDSRDDHILPSSGSLIQFSQEYAGIGGDVQFEKHEFQFQYNRSLPLSSVIQLTLDTGLITSLLRGKPRINDLFTLGGPLTVRGFNLHGVGPSQDGCALGGDTFFAGGLHLYTPLPFRPGRGGFGDLFRSHFFLTAGSLTRRILDNGEILPLSGTIQNFGDTVRLSCGAGIVLRMGGIARLELNYVIPVLIRKGDSVCKGVQFGIGVSYS